MKCMHNLVFIVLNVRDGTESKYPLIVFLSIHCHIQCSAYSKKCHCVQQNTQKNMILVSFKCLYLCNELNKIT